MRWVDDVARHAYRTPDGVALRFAGQSTTWVELHRRVQALGAWLHERGSV